jgi:hypothetical protein
MASADPGVHVSCGPRPLDWASTQVQTAAVGAHGKRGEIQDNAASGVQTCAH